MSDMAVSSKVRHPRPSLWLWLRRHRLVAPNADKEIRIIQLGLDEDRRYAHVDDILRHPTFSTNNESCPTLGHVAAQADYQGDGTFGQRAVSISCDPETACSYTNARVCVQSSGNLGNTARRQPEVLRCDD